VAEENDDEFLSEEKSATGTEGVPSSDDQNKPVTAPPDAVYAVDRYI
jgi:hypothetical protein